MRADGVVGNEPRSAPLAIRSQQGALRGHKRKLRSLTNHPACAFKGTKGIFLMAQSPHLAKAGTSAIEIALVVIPNELHYLNVAGCAFLQASYRILSVLTGLRFSPTLI
jgi:hypothetical protein